LSKLAVLPVVEQDVFDWLEPIPAAVVRVVDSWNLPTVKVGIKAYLSRSELCNNRANALRSLSVGL
jgi:hypothetical protein